MTTTPATNKPSARYTKAVKTLREQAIDLNANAQQTADAICTFDEQVEAQGSKPNYKAALTEAIAYLTAKVEEGNAAQEAKHAQQSKHLTRMANDPEYRAEVLAAAKAEQDAKAAEKAAAKTDKPKATKSDTPKVGKAGARTTREGGKWDSRKNRQTGTTVTVYDTKAAGIDAATKWVAKCEDHDTLHETKTYAEAVKSLSLPADWCEHCKAHTAA